MVSDKLHGRKPFRHGQRQTRKNGSPTQKRVLASETGWNNLSALLCLAPPRQPNFRSNFRKVDEMRTVCETRTPLFPRSGNGQVPQLCSMFAMKSGGVRSVPIPRALVLSDYGIVAA